MSENLNLSSSAVLTLSVSPVSLSKRASIATKTAQRIVPTASTARPMSAGLFVSANVYISPAVFCLTIIGATRMAVAVPKRAMASWSPIARAILRPLNHFAIDLVTETPAISLPSPKSMQPTYAMARDVSGSNPADMANVTRAAPPVIMPTKIDPTRRTPNLSSNAPQIMRPPHMHRNEYPLA